MINIQYTANGKSCKPKHQNNTDLQLKQKAATAPHRNFIMKMGKYNLTPIR